MVTVPGDMITGVPCAECGAALAIRTVASSGVPGKPGSAGVSDEMYCPVCKPRPEAKAAAAWWASRLGRASHDLGTREPGEAASTAFAGFASAVLGDRFTDGDRDAFRRELALAIEDHLASSSWRPDEPRWGSAIRAIMVDYGPDPVLKQAAQRAGLELKTLDLPLKTVMWVNPGQVSVGEGYNAPPVVIWPGNPGENCGRP